MTFPIDIHIGSVVISSHLIFDLLAFSIGIRYFFRLRSHSSDVISEDDRWTLIMGAALGALIGSRLLALLENVAYTMANFSFLAIYAQETIVGGIIGGIIGVEIAKKLKGIRTSTGDLYVFPIILGTMIGRVGCFLTGVSDHTVGLPSSLPWAFDQGDGIPRHPTSLYEILFLAIFWVVLARMQKSGRLRNGALFRIFIVGYLVFRLLIDFIKPRDTLFLGLTSIQLGALLFAAFYIFELVWIYAYRPFMRKALQ